MVLLLDHEQGVLDGCWCCRRRDRANGPFRSSNGAERPVGTEVALRVQPRGPSRFAINGGAWRRHGTPRGSCGVDRPRPSQRRDSDRCNPEHGLAPHRHKRTSAARTLQWRVAEANTLLSRLSRPPLSSAVPPLTANSGLRLVRPWPRRDARPSCEPARQCLPPGAEPVDAVSLRLHPPGQRPQLQRERPPLPSPSQPRMRRLIRREAAVAPHCAGSPPASR
jgi:hypothetical protein